MHMELELFAMETRDGEEEIAGNAPVAGAVSGGKERWAAVNCVQWKGETRDEKRAGNAQ